MIVTVLLWTKVEQNRHVYNTILTTVKESVQFTLRLLMTVCIHLHWNWILISVNSNTVEFICNIYLNTQCSIQFLIHLLSITLKLKLWKYFNVIYIHTTQLYSLSIWNGWQKWYRGETTVSKSLGWIHNASNCKPCVLLLGRMVIYLIHKISLLNIEFDWGFIFPCYTAGPKLD